MKQAKIDEIIQQVIRLFMTCGIKSVTMDDVAKNLSMSKKTLYQYVDDKNTLVSKCLEHDLLVHKEGIRNILAQNFNAIDENMAISRFVSGHLRQMHPSIFYDLQKYYPNEWSKLQNKREGQTEKVLHNNIEKGILEGFFRADLHVEIQTRLWMARMKTIFDPGLFSNKQFTITEVYEQMIMHQLRGMASKKGLEYIETQINLPAE